MLSKSPPAPDIQWLHQKNLLNLLQDNSLFTSKTLSWKNVTLVSMQ